MSDKITFSLVTGNKAPVTNVSGLNATGMKGESKKGTEVVIDVFKDTQAEVSGLSNLSIIGADFSNEKANAPIQKGTSQDGEGAASKVNDNIYQANFEEIEEIGQGGFGTVFKVKDKIDEQIYAVKKISIGGSNPDTIDSILKEVKTLAKINSDRVVRYYNSWVENNNVFIKMEFCSDNLKNTIQQKREVFQREASQVMDVIEYYISCQILKELVECVGYLHGLNPPIIHRDLKPQNVLVLEKPNNGKYLKLCDFGLAVVHDMQGMSHTEGVGTLAYVAPEILNGTHYDLKADVYSLGVITEQLYDLDTNSSNSINPLDEELKQKFAKLTELILAMKKSPGYKMRPTCAQVLEEIKNISIAKNLITGIKQYVPAIIQLNTAGKQIFLDYLTQ